MNNDRRIMGRLNKIGFHPYIITKKEDWVMSHIYVLAANLPKILRKFELLDKYPESNVFTNTDIVSPEIDMFDFFIEKDRSISPLKMHNWVAPEMLDDQNVDSIDIIKLRIWASRYDEMMEDLAGKIRSVINETEIKSCE